MKENLLRRSEHKNSDLRRIIQNYEQSARAENDYNDIDSPFYFPDDEEEDNENENNINNTEEASFIAKTQNSELFPSLSVTNKYSNLENEPEASNAGIKIENTNEPTCSSYNFNSFKVKI